MPEGLRVINRLMFQGADGNLKLQVVEMDQGRAWASGWARRNESTIYDWSRELPNGLELWLSIHTTTRQYAEENVFRYLATADMGIEEGFFVMGFWDDLAGVAWYAGIGESLQRTAPRRRSYQLGEIPLLAWQEEIGEL